MLYLIQLIPRPVLLPPSFLLQQFVEEVEERLGEDKNTLGRQLASQALNKLYSALTRWLDSLGHDEPKHRHIVCAGITLVLA